MPDLWDGSPPVCRMPDAATADRFAQFAVAHAAIATAAHRLHLPARREQGMRADGLPEEGIEAMTTPELLALAGRLEAATAGSRELSALIWEAAGHCAHRETKYYSIEDGNDYDSGHTCLACGKDTHGEGVPLLSRSLDGITSVIEAAEMSVESARSPYALDGRAFANVWENLPNGRTRLGRAFGATEALARSAAFVRALAAEATDAG